MGYLLDLLNETDRIQKMLKECQTYVETNRGESTGGNGTDGEGTDGEGTDGEGTDGEGTDGEGTDGEGTDGEGRDSKSRNEDLMNAKIDQHTEPSLVHPHSQEKFYYLSAKCEESEYLSAELTEQQSFILCLYAIVDKPDFTPMLAFVQQLVSNQYAFPRFNQEPVINDHVMNECHKQIYSIFGITPGMNVELFELCFKGCLEMNDSLMLFFDTSRLLEHQLTTATHLGTIFNDGTIWATYNELMNHKIFDVDVEASVPDFMAQHEFLTNITNSGKKVANPITLYPITLDFQVPSELISHHPVLGEVALFTDAFVNYPNPPESSKRYVGFVDGCLELGPAEGWPSQLQNDAADKTGYKFNLENKTVFGMKSSAFYQIL